MKNRTVENKRNRQGQIKQRKAVEEKNSGPLWDWRHTVEHEKEQNQPKDGVDRLERELGRCEQQGEE